MLDLSAASTLQAAALRRMTSDPALTARCDAWLRDRGVRGVRHLGTLLFAEFAALGLLFVWMDFDEMGDAELPSKGSLFWAGAQVTFLIAAWVAAIVFLVALVGSWRWRGGMILALAGIGTLSWYWEEVLAWCRLRR